MIGATLDRVSEQLEDECQRANKMRLCVCRWKKRRSSTAQVESDCPLDVAKLKVLTSYLSRVVVDKNLSSFVNLDEQTCVKSAAADRPEDSGFSANSLLVSGDTSSMADSGCFDLAAETDEKTSKKVAGSVRSLRRQQSALDFANGLLNDTTTKRQESENSEATVTAEGGRRVRRKRSFSCHLPLNDKQASLKAAMSLSKRLFSSVSLYRVAAIDGCCYHQYHALVKTHKTNRPQTKYILSGQIPCKNRQPSRSMIELLSPLKRHDTSQIPKLNKRTILPLFHAGLVQPRREAFNEPVTKLHPPTRRLVGCAGVQVIAGPTVKSHARLAGEDAGEILDPTASTVVSNMLDDVQAQVEKVKVERFGTLTPVMGLAMSNAGIGHRRRPFSEGLVRRATWKPIRRKASPTDALLKYGSVRSVVLRGDSPFPLRLTKSLDQSELGRQDIFIRGAENGESKPKAPLDNAKMSLCGKEREVISTVRPREDEKRVAEGVRTKGLDAMPYVNSRNTISEYTLGRLVPYPMVANSLSDKVKDIVKAKCCELQTPKKRTYKRKRIGRSLQLPNGEQVHSADLSNFSLCDLSRVEALGNVIPLKDQIGSAMEHALGIAVTDQNRRGERDQVALTPIRTEVRGPCTSSPKKFRALPVESLHLESPPKSEGKLPSFRLIDSNDETTNEVGRVESPTIQRFAQKIRRAVETGQEWTKMDVMDGRHSSLSALKRTTVSMEPLSGWRQARWPEKAPQLGHNGRLASRVTFVRNIAFPKEADSSTPRGLPLYSTRFRGELSGPTLFYVGPYCGRSELCFLRLRNGHLLFVCKWNSAVILQSGDVVIEINGHSTERMNMRTLQTFLKNCCYYTLVVGYTSRMGTGRKFTRSSLLSGGYGAGTGMPFGNPFTGLAGLAGMGVPLRPGRSGGAMVAINETREREKRELSHLNDKFAQYVEKVRFLEAQNKKLHLELEALQGKAGQGSSRIKEMYEIEMQEARKLIDDTGKDKALAEVKAQNAEAEANSFKKRYQEMLMTRGADRQQLDALEQEIAENEAKIHLLRRRLTDLEDEGRRYKAETQRLLGEISRLTNELQNEAFAKSSLETEKMALEDELQMLKQMHEAELNDLKTRTNIDVGLDPSQFFRNELANAIKEIRNEYELANEQQRNDLHNRYMMHYNELVLRHQKPELDPIQYEQQRVQEEKLRVSLTCARNEVTQMKSRNEELAQRIRDVQAMIDGEKEEGSRMLSIRDQELDDLRLKLEQLLKEYEEVSSMKTSLEKEISQYRELLEGTTSHDGLRQVVEHIEEEARRLESERGFESITSAGGVSSLSRIAGSASLTATNPVNYGSRSVSSYTSSAIGQLSKSMGGTTSGGSSSTTVNTSYSKNYTSRDF